MFLRHSLFSSHVEAGETISINAALSLKDRGRQDGGCLERRSLIQKQCLERQTAKEDRH